MKEKEVEKILKALANRRRLAILKLLKESKGMDVGTIAEKINLSFKSTSRHLAVMTSADILEKEQKGLNMYYRISSEIPALAVRITTFL